MLYITRKAYGMKSNPEILTLSEFADFMGVHYLTARKYVSAGLLDAYGAYRLPSGYWRIPRQCAEQYKASLTQKPRPQHRPPARKAKRPAPKR